MPPAPKNFDEARPALPEEERAFILRGETFLVVPSVRPEVMAEYDAPSDSVEAMLTMIDGVMLKLLDPRDDAHARYRRVREQEDWPVSIHDLKDLVQWIFAVQSGRPTLRPGDSSTGPVATGTVSKAVSSSQAEAA